MGINGGETGGIWSTKRITRKRYWLISARMTFFGQDSVLLEYHCFLWRFSRRSVTRFQAALGDLGSTALCMS